MQRLPRFLLLLITTLVLVRCAGDEPISSEAEAADVIGDEFAAIFGERTATPSSAAETLYQRLTSGGDAGYLELIDRVAKGDHGDSVWVRFKSGRIYSYRATVDPVDTSAADTGKKASPLQSSAWSRNNEEPHEDGHWALAPDVAVELAQLDQQRERYEESMRRLERAGGALEPTSFSSHECVFPEKRRALVANSATATHPWMDVTWPVMYMLKNRGYDVDIQLAELETFRKLTDYNVIFLESHGGWAPRVIHPRPNRAVILTATEATPELETRYASALDRGTLVVQRELVRKVSGPMFSKNFVGVTPDFVEGEIEKSKQSFGDRTQLYVSGCRGFELDASGKKFGSGWAELLFDHGQGGLFVGWTDKVDWKKSSRAFLELLQAMTGSNEEYDNPAGAAVGLPGKLLEKNTPPLNGHSFITSYHRVVSKGLNVDSKHAKLSLLHYAHDPDLNTPNNYLAWKIHALAPYVIGFDIADKGSLGLWACAPNGGGATLDVGSSSVRLGQRNTPYPFLWKIARSKLSPGAHGQVTLTLADGKRVGPELQLLRFKLSVNAMETWPGTNQVITSSYDLSVRQMPRHTCSDSFPLTAAILCRDWEKDGYWYFDNTLDHALSSVTWKVTGVDTAKQSDGTVCIHSFMNGSTSSRKMKSDGSDSSYLDSGSGGSGGKVATLDVSLGDASYPYKETVACSDGSSSVHTHHGYLGFGLKQKISVGVDWKLAAGKLIDGGGGASTEYAWAASTPSMKLDPGKMRAIKGYNFSE